MKSWLKTAYHFFPVQLFVLHFRKYQILLLFWFILFSTINSGFLKTFGADALFFAPEYLGRVNVIGALITGFALGVFIMSWNVTTFILHTKRFKFLATTANPFMKYCINNAVLPLAFIIFYLVRLYRFDEFRELMQAREIMTIMVGLIGGIILTLLISFLYFFTAEKRIVRNMAPIVADPKRFHETFALKEHPHDAFGIQVDHYLSGRFHIRKVRKVSHYRRDYIDTVFKHNHIAAIASILLAFLFLVIIGFLSENRFFEMPAAASILVFFAVMIAVIGALTYFLQSWSLPFAIILVAILNVLFKHEIIDPRNKAYGLNYEKRELRPAYDKGSLQAIASPANIEADKSHMLTILNKWKARQKEEKPVMIFINVSGGGLRSAAFVMNTLQKIDSISQGELMRKTFLISGASGRMLSATYYRELNRLKLNRRPGVNLHDARYTDRISRDLLNPIFTSMIARDIFAPVQKFKVGEHSYIKDRGYAFEKKLGDNSGGLLNIQLKDMADDEREARVPLIFFNSVIKSDGRKMIISSQPVRFMMKPAVEAGDTLASPDAVDFRAMFSKQEPDNLRILTALRMNATFPYVLPNVWLPSRPVIDVMDAGLRDNYGQETSLRFMDYFSGWLKENTSGIIILQLRDRQNDNWQNPFETNSVSDMIVTPATMLQHNWFKLQDFFQKDQYSYFNDQHALNIQRITFMYIPETIDKGAALNFHLTAREKRDIIQSFRSPVNQVSLKQLMPYLKH